MFDSTPKRFTLQSHSTMTCVRSAILTHTKRELSQWSGKAIECNICYFTWQIKCLNPLISVEQQCLLAGKFFVCNNTYVWQSAMLICSSDESYVFSCRIYLYMHILFNINIYIYITLTNVLEFLISYLPNNGILFKYINT